MSFSFDFNNESQEHQLILTVEPIIWLKKIVFKTNDTNWIQRLSIASLRIEIIHDAHTVYKRSVQFLTPGVEYLRTPELELNQFIKPSTNHLAAQNIVNDNFSIIFFIENLTLRDGESVIIEGMHRQYVMERVDNWIQRVEEMYIQIEGWIRQENLYRAKRGLEVIMYEQLMFDFEVPQKKIDTLDIFKENKLLATFKPKGLWAIGINGLIDVISMKGNFVLGDKAHAFQHPQWQIFSQGNTKSGKDFTNAEFFKLL